MLRYITTLISDGLIALLVVSLLFWLMLTQPLLPTKGNKHGASSLESVSESRLKKHVTQLSLVYAPRTVGFGNLDYAAHYIHRQFMKSGAAYFQRYKTLNGYFNNVILELGPETNEIVVIGAHYDARDDSLDAEGNASGVATLIELAHQLALHENDLSIRVQLVAYPLSQSQTLRREDSGSFNHVEWLAKSHRKVKMMFSLDSVGRFNKQAGSQHYPFSFMQYLYPDNGDYISLVGRIEDFVQLRATKNSFAKASTLPLYSFNTLDDFPGFSSLDHQNYWQKGYPAFLITDTASYRQLDNQSADVPERLDYHKMALLVAGLHQVVMDAKTDDITSVQLARQNSRNRNKSSGRLQ